LDASFYFDGYIEALKHFPATIHHLPNVIADRFSRLAGKGDSIPADKHNIYDVFQNERPVTFDIVMILDERVGTGLAR